MKASIASEAAAAAAAGRPRESPAIDAMRDYYGHGKIRRKSPTRCACAPGWSGEKCEEDEDECLSSPCEEGGACLQDKAGSYRCLCAAGRGGARCEITAAGYDEVAALAEAAPSSCEGLGRGGFFDGVGGGAVALPPLGESLPLFSTAFWLRPFSLPEGEAQRVILSSGGGLGEPELYLEDGALIFAVGGSEPVSGDGASPERRQLSHRFAWNPPANGWAYIVVSYGAALPSEAQQGFLDLYVDFHFVESAALPGPAVDLRRLRVGSSGGRGASLYHGMLASLQIWDRP